MVVTLRCLKKKKKSSPEKDIFTPGWESLLRRLFFYIGCNLRFKDIPKIFSEQKKKVLVQYVNGWNTVDNTETEGEL